MKIGYARVSTADQNADLQKDALLKADCKTVYVDKMSGTIKERPQLRKALDSLKSGDTLVVWRLDRLGRSMQDLILIVSEIKDRGANFASLSEAIDTSTATGKLIFHVLSALAEFERNLIVERTNAGLQAAKLRGRTGGRKERIFTDEEKASMKQLYTEGAKINFICAAHRVSKPTFYKILKQAQ